MKIVTSFHAEAPYWRAFLKTYLDHVDLPLTVYFEGALPQVVLGATGDKVRYTNAGREIDVEYKNLGNDPDLRWFLKVWGNLETANGVRYVGGKRTVDYRYNAIKFAKKVFAMTAETEDCAWCDADVIFTNTAHFVDCMPVGKVAYLGRKDWHHSECGWVSYRDAQDVLQAMRQMYLSGRVFDLEEWHDSYVFDVVRQTFDPDRFVNLTPDARGLDVWEQSPLAAFSHHHKGPIAKQQVYEHAV